MKLKLIPVIVFLLVIYMLLPSDGVWFNDVTLATQDNRKSLFASYTSSREEFASKADILRNPEVNYIVHPVTSYSRDGKNSPNATMYLTSGWIRTGSYNTGRVHGALDTDIVGYNDLDSCPAGYHDCDDVALIAPITGVVEKVVNNVGKESQYYEDQVNTSMVAIKATGAFEGWTVYVMHLSSIPNYITEGYTINQGDYIGFQCSQGRSTGSHVHVEVRSGGSDVPIGEWMPYLTTHSSIKTVEDHTGGIATLSLQGWLSKDVTKLNTNPKYESTVTIPDQFKIS